MNWREEAEEKVKERLAWPFEGMCFDIQNNAFWLSEWGERPPSNKDACLVAKQAVDKAPVLIPIFSHRYISDRPHENGNPVLSVYQTDIIYYGANLFDYIENEFPEAFGRSKPTSPRGDIKRIEFWSQVMEAR